MYSLRWVEDSGVKRHSCRIAKQRHKCRVTGLKTQGDKSRLVFLLSGRFCFLKQNQVSVKKEAGVR